VFLHCLRARAKQINLNDSILKDQTIHTTHTLLAVGSTVQYEVDSIFSWCSCIAYARAQSVCFFVRFQAGAALTCCTHQREHNNDEDVDTGQTDPQIKTKNADVFCCSSVRHAMQAEEYIDVRQGTNQSINQSRGMMTTACPRLTNHVLLSLLL
jgi:hypothetical protein